ncbi:MAG: HIT domain-containing protein [Methylomonas sp.]|jgi:diadenosine tetraphosphate (Ap4A) HIT family hydrolase
MMTNFQLHPRLQQDTLVVGQFTLSGLFMMNDCNYPWFILVPMRAGITEIYQLSQADRQTLWAESCLLAEKLQLIYQPDKLNIASIGNIVSQLHLHHVARFRRDLAWPAPVWGKFPAQPYPEERADAEIAKMRAALSAALVD